MQKNLKKQILNSLIHSENYCRKALPHIKSEYFEREYRPVYELILTFIKNYNKLPTPAALHIEFGNSEYTSRKDINEITQLINSLETKSDVETNEKNKPVRKSRIIKKNKNLSIFFHQL